ncbi:phage tail spike protein, partial [Niallia circulans]
MFPILYKANETSFIHNGLGVLKDAISVKAIEELNGLFELEIEYDPEGFLIDEIDYEMIVKAKVNDKQEEQLFRIYSFDKSFQNDNILIHCQHITYDAAGNFVEELELNNVTTDVAMQTLQSKLAYPSKITFSSPNTTTRSSTKLYRTNPLQMVAGMDGSILDNWGGEIERDNFRLVMHARRGKDDGVLIAYKKNLTGLEAKFDMSNVVTRIFPFAIKDDVLITIPNKYIDSPNINAYEHIKIEPVDFSGDENITDSTSLYNASKNYFNTGGKDLPTVSMDVEFEPLWDTEEYKNLAVLELVGMGDTVTVRHTKMGIDVTAKVNRIEYDVIAQKNSAVGIGSVQAGLTDKVNKSTNMENAVKQALNVANQAIVSANGKNNTYFGPNEPVGSFLEGDLWFKLVDDDFTQTYRFDGIQWQLIVDMDVNAAKQEAAEASQRAEDAFNRANEATENAQKAIEDAQTSFDKAQDALDTASAVNSIAVDAVNVANTAKQNAQNALNKATSLETEVGSISDDLAEAGGKITTIEQNVDTINNSLTTTIRTLSNLDGVVSEQQTVITALDEKIELRATKTSVDTLTGRVSDTESNIKSMAGQISLMAKAEDVYTKAQVDSSLKGKVDTSTYTSKMSQIDLSINGITNRVSSTESNINTINSNIASLDIKADGIISSVSQVQTN